MLWSQCDRQTNVAIVVFVGIYICIFLFIFKSNSRIIKYHTWKKQSHTRVVEALLERSRRRNANTERERKNSTQQSTILKNQIQTSHAYRIVSTVTSGARSRAQRTLSAVASSSAIDSVDVVFASTPRANARRNELTILEEKNVGRIQKVCLTNWN